MNHVLLVYLSSGVFFASLLAATLAAHNPASHASSRRSGHERGASVALYPLVLTFILALRSDRFYEWMRGWSDEY